MHGCILLRVGSSWPIMCTANNNLCTGSYKQSTRGKHCVLKCISDAYIAGTGVQVFCQVHTCMNLTDALVTCCGANLNKLRLLDGQ